MSGDLSSTQASHTGTAPAAELFQKAHARMVGLRRLDEQVLQLLEQRQKLRQELLQLQRQINDEFERVITAPALDSTQDVRAPRDGAPEIESNGARPAPADSSAEEPSQTNGKAPVRPTAPRRNYAFVNVSGSSPTPVPTDGAWVNPAINALRAAVGANVIAAERPG